MTTREGARVLARRGTLLTGLMLVALVGVFVRALLFTPVERFQGPAQKIFYVHAPAAWSALMAFAITGVLSILYLWLRDHRMDLAAMASAEVGVAFSVVMLTTGPIWGKPIWGTWWTWDARLTSTLFIFLLFIGYLVMRGAVTDPDTRARYSAVLGIMGLVLVPFIHATVFLFRTLHPDPIVMKPERPSLPGDMLLTLLLSFAVFTLLYVGFTLQRYALAVLEDLRDQEAANRAVS
ncbi:MAG TPA: cytochrome c biogenesis protein CcsA [Gemmatimonadales bacterium]|nr:cytochrome c biogenesis protein CcsA [Gemmatimonadales bacterium]